METCAVWQPALYGNQCCMAIHAIWQPVPYGNPCCVATSAVWQPVLCDNSRNVATRLVWQPVLYGKRCCKATCTVWQPLLCGNQCCILRDLITIVMHSSFFMQKVHRQQKLHRMSIYIRKKPAPNVDLHLPQKSFFTPPLAGNFSHQSLDYEMFSTKIHRQRSLLSIALSLHYFLANCVKVPIAPN